MGLALSALANLPRSAPDQIPARAQLYQRRASAPKAPALVEALRDGRPFDINAASAADLELLPGVGPALARRIVAHRAQHGAFVSVDGLRAVHGIGPKTIERLRPLISVRTSTPATE